MPQNVGSDDVGSKEAVLQPMPRAERGAVNGVIAESATPSQALADGAPANSVDANHASHSNNASQNHGRSSGRGQTLSSTALQDMFLNGLRRENIDVVVYFSDGTQERGMVRAFDTFTILLENRGSGKAQLIYKHAVTRIFPVRTPTMALDRAIKKREE